MSQSSAVLDAEFAFDRSPAGIRGRGTGGLNLLRLLGVIAGIAIVWLVLVQLARDWQQTEPEAGQAARQIAEDARESLEAAAEGWRTELGGIAVRIAAASPVGTGPDDLKPLLRSLETPAMSDLRLHSLVDGGPDELRPGGWRLSGRQTGSEQDARAGLAMRVGVLVGGAPAVLTAVADAAAFRESLRSASERLGGQVVVALDDGSFIAPEGSRDLARAAEPLPAPALPQGAGAARIAGRAQAVAAAAAPELHARILAAVPQAGALATSLYRSFALVCSAAALIVLMWMTVRQALRRERRQMAMLNGAAAASAELVRIHDPAALVGRLCHLVPSIVGGGTARILAPGAAPAAAERVLDLGGQSDARLAVALPPVVRSDPAAPLTLAQIARSARAALETIELLHGREDALRRATLHRLEAEAAQREVQAVFAAMSDAVIGVDPDGRITYANANARNLLAAGRPLIGLASADLLPGLDGAHPVSADDVPPAPDAGERHLAWRQEGQGAARTLSVRVFPHDRGRAIYLRDVTAQVEAEQRMREAAKMDAIGHLTGGIAHDFNNLLTVVLGSLEFAELDDTLDPEIREALDQAARAARSAAELTRQLMAFARRQPLSPRAVDVASLMRHAGDLLRRTLGGGVAVSVEAADGQWPALADPTQLQAAVINLAVNARDAMPNGGRLTIQAFNRTEAGAADAAAGDYACVSVRDEGGGIPPADLERVFEPFFTTKAPGKGTGLGLAMVYGFVRQSGGWVRIESPPEGGTVVTLGLPRAREAGAPASRLAEPDCVQAGTAQSGAAEAAGRGERVMLVEDIPAVRDDLVRRLVRLGYRVDALPDAASAQERMAAGLWPDLLLSDVVMPGGMDGAALLEWVKTRRPELPVLLMSGDLGPTRRDDRIAAAEIVAKPVDTAKLAARIRGLLDAGAEGLTRPLTFVDSN